MTRFHFSKAVDPTTRRGRDRPAGAVHHCPAEPSTVFTTLSRPRMPIGRRAAKLILRSEELRGVMAHKKETTARRVGGPSPPSKAGPSPLGARGPRTVGAPLMPGSPIGARRRRLDGRTRPIERVVFAVDRCAAQR